MIKIEVKSASVTPRTITPKSGNNAGRQMTFHEQEAYAWTFGDDGKPRPYPQRITLNIDADRGQQPYPPGLYTVCPSSVYVDRFYSLTLGRVKLVPVAATPAQPAQRAA